MASRLSVYNGALRHLGERRLVDLAEERSARRELDAAYDDGIKFCLLKGYWNHAMRSVQTIASDSLEPSFGYSSIHVKPGDWLRTYVVSENEYFDPPLLRYSDETEYWHADSAELYVRYISWDLGKNEALWPVNFSNYVEAYLARKICPIIKPGGETALDKVVKKALADAKAIDAMNEPNGFPPMGTWASSRNGQSMRGSRWSGRWSDG